MLVEQLHLLYPGSSTSSGGVMGCVIQSPRSSERAIRMNRKCVQEVLPLCIRISLTPVRTSVILNPPASIIRSHHFQFWVASRGTWCWYTVMQVRWGKDLLMYSSLIFLTRVRPAPLSMMWRLDLWPYKPNSVNSQGLKNSKEREAVLTSITTATGHKTNSEWGYKYLVGLNIVARSSQGLIRAQRELGVYRGEPFRMIVGFGSCYSRVLLSLVLLLGAARGARKGALRSGGGREGTGTLKGVG